MVKNDGKFEVITVNCEENSQTVMTQVPKVWKEKGREL